MNLTVSHQKRFVWFRVAKVGTRTILNHLIKNDIPLDIKEGFNIHYSASMYADYFKFAFVRNPWDRLISCWRDKVLNLKHFKFNDVEYEKMQDLNNFVDYASKLNLNKCDPHLRLQATLIDLNSIDYLGRMETFDCDFKKILRKLELPEKEIHRKNVTSVKVDYREYYDDQLMKKIAHLYQKDIQIFGYQF